MEEKLNSVSMPENTFEIMKSLIRDHDRKKIIWCIVLFVALGLLWWPLGIFPVFLYVTHLYIRAQSVFMKEFARVNNLKYVLKESLDSVSGRMFKKVGRLKEFEKFPFPLIDNLNNLTNVVYGQYNGFPMRLFNYSYSEGGGKNRRTYSFTVCELGLEKTDFPFLLLKSNSMSRYGGRDMFGEDKDIEIKLEGDFGKTFRLFTRQNYEIEALQIFTPDVMVYLKDEAPNFSIEFAGNKVYLYDDKIISNKAEMDQMYTVLKKIIDTTGHFLNRLHDDYQVMHEVYAKEGQNK